MSKTKRRKAVTDDEGVSPVIAVILMVAITVVLAATVYVWVSGFATEDTGPEQAAATAKGVDLNNDGDAEWVQLTLTSGENAPYDSDDVSYSLTAPDGTGLHAESEDYLCASAVIAGSTATPSGTHCDSAFSGSWDVGENLWVPCQSEANGPGDNYEEDSGNHLVTISLSGTTILDSTISCDSSPEDPDT